MSLNAYGSIDSNDVSQTSGATSGGGAGGGGSSTNTQSFVSDILGIDFIDQIHRAVLSQLVSGSIKVVWDSPNNMVIKSIIVSDSPFIVRFQDVPFSLIGNSDGVSDGIINYSVKIPNKFCEGVATIGCVQNIRYEIPVTISATHDDSNVTKNTVIIIDMTGKQDIPFIFVLLAISAVPLAYFARKIHIPKHKRKAYSSNGKSRKNGSASNSLSL